MNNDPEITTRIVHSVKISELKDLVDASVSTAVRAAYWTLLTCVGLTVAGIVLIYWMLALIERFFAAL